jgi:hypothetical protein
MAGWALAIALIAVGLGVLYRFSGDPAAGEPDDADAIATKVTEATTPVDHIDAVVAQTDAVDLTTRLQTSGARIDDHLQGLQQQIDPSSQPQDRQPPEPAPKASASEVMDAVRSATGSIDQVATKPLLPQSAPRTIAEEARLRQAGRTVSTLLSQGNTPDRELIDRLLAEKTWHLRAFALLRLARYDDEHAARLVHSALTDEAWQIRLLALLECDRRDLPVNPAIFAAERQAEVLRAMLLLDIPVSEPVLAVTVRRLLDSSHFTEQLVAVELIILSQSEAYDLPGVIRKISNHMARMEPAEILQGIRPLSRLLGKPPGELNRNVHPYLMMSGGGVSTVLSRERLLVLRPSWERPRVAGLETKDFEDIIMAIDDLRSKDFDVALVLGLGSADWVLLGDFQDQGEVMLAFLGQVAASARVVVAGFRSHYDDKTVEVGPVTDDPSRLAAFFRSLEAKGIGGSNSGSLLSGLKALGAVHWRRNTDRHMVVVSYGADDHQEKDHTRELLLHVVKKGVTPHFVSSRPEFMFRDYLPMIRHAGSGTQALESYSPEIPQTIVSCILGPQVVEQSADLYRFMQQWSL